MYALNLSESGRVLSATFRKYAPSGAVFVSELPEGNISDYLYIDGAFIFNPIPTQEVEEMPSADQRITELEEALNSLLEGLV